MELNPAPAAMVRRAEDYPWSSAREHVGSENEAGLKMKSIAPCARPFGPRKRDRRDWPGRGEIGPEKAGALRERTRTGRPWGEPAFVKRLECQTGTHSGAAKARPDGRGE